MKKHQLLCVLKDKFAGRTLWGVLAATVFVSLVSAVGALATAQTQLVSVNRFGTNGGNSYSEAPVISADGRFVAFYSTAGDLVSNDPNSTFDVFRRDLQTGTTLLVSVNPTGTTSGNGYVYGVDSVAINADGRFVAFEGIASDLAGNDTNGKRDIFVRDLQA